MSPRKSIEQELTKEMILEAARGLFIQEGYDHVSMRKIAKVLDCSHGAIYYHFKNKADLFYALVAKGFSLLDSELDRVMEKQLPNEQKLMNIFLEYIRFGINNSSHYETMFLTKDQELKSFLQDEPNQSFEKFTKAVNILTNDSVTLQEVWFVFLSLHGFVAHYCFKGQCFDDISVLAKSHCSLLIKAIKK